MSIKFEITALAVRAAGGGSPLAAFTEIVEACCDLAAAAGCAEELASVLAGEAALIRATPREANIVMLEALAQQAAREVREGGQL